MKQSAFSVACLLAVGVSLLAFPDKAGAQSSCNGGSCTNNPNYYTWTIDCGDSCYGGLSSYNIIVPEAPDGYGIYNIWFPNMFRETCCFGQQCMPAPPSDGCGIALLHDVDPSEMFALGLDTPFFFVRGCDGEYSVIRLVPNS